MNDAILTNEERVVLSLRDLYRRFGYLPYRMRKFEEYELYIRNKEFMVSDRVIAFNDTNGDLLALKPDVTLSIIKGGEDRPGEKQKVYYDENVYRVSKSTHRFKEIRQAGLECIGDVDLYDIFEVVSLAAETLSNVGEDYVLTVSHLGVLGAVLSGVSDDPGFPAAASACISGKNPHDLAEVCRRYGVTDEGYGVLCRLMQAYGEPDEVLSVLRELPVKVDLDEPTELAKLLRRAPFAGRLRYDFSLTGDVNYYNGFIFKGFLSGIASDVLSGGQYDRMMEKMGRTSRAVGFALYLDLLERRGNAPDECDVDTLLLYDGATPPEAVAEKVRELTGRGVSVSAQHTVPGQLRYRTLLDLRGGNTSC